MRTVLLLLAFVALGLGTVEAQPNGGAPYAHFDLHAGASFPIGLFNAGARMRVMPLLSLEAEAGFLPLRFAWSAGINLHTSPMFDLDPAISMLGTYFQREGTKWYTGSLMFGFLQLRKTSLHAVIRGGLSLLYERRPDGTHSFYPAPAIDVGLAYGLE